MYTLRTSERQSGWVTITTSEDLNKIIEEFENQIELDEEEKTTDLRTEILDENGNVVKSHEGVDY